MSIRMKSDVYNLLCQVNASCQLHNRFKDNQYKTSNE